MDPPNFTLFATKGYSYEASIVLVMRHLCGGAVEVPKDGFESVRIVNYRMRRLARLKVL